MCVCVSAHRNVVSHSADSHVAVWVNLLTGKYSDGKLIKAPGSYLVISHLYNGLSTHQQLHPTQMHTDLVYTAHFFLCGQQVSGLLHRCSHISLPVSDNNDTKSSSSRKRNCSKHLNSLRWGLTGLKFFFLIQIVQRVFKDSGYTSEQIWMFLNNPLVFKCHWLSVFFGEKNAT